MNWKYTATNKKANQPSERDIERLKAFLDSLFGVLGSFGAKLEGDYGFASVTVNLDGYTLEWDKLAHGVGVSSSNGIELGKLRIGDEP